MAPPKPEAYVPYLQHPTPTMTLVTRSSSDPKALAAAIRGQVISIDKNQPVHNVKTMEEIAASLAAPRRVSTFLITVFAGLGLILAAAGIYSVISYSVAQRTHEIGLRMALGAQQSDIFRMILGQGLLMVLIGLVVGLIAAFFLTRLLSSLLYGVSVTDPFIFAGISLLITGVAIVATYVPARRAMKVDPLIALKYE